MRRRAARFWRVLWPVVVAAGGAVTCDAPTNLSHHRAQLAVAPVFSRDALGGYAGLNVDQVRLVVTRPPATEALAQVILPFDVDSQSITASIDVDVNNGAESLLVRIDLMAGGQIVFTGTQMVLATSGVTSGPTTPIPVTYSGPGSGIAAIRITPRDSGTVLGASVPFSVTATDSQNNAVGQFYVKWWTGSTVHVINAIGVLKAGNARGSIWVHARTPNGVQDSTRLMVAPVPSQVQIVSGNTQSGVIGTALVQPLVVRVLAADNLPVAGVPVTFATSSGGSVAAPATRATDTLGLASALVTLGGGTGQQTFTATVQGVPPVTFSATATTAAGVPAALQIIAGNGQTGPAGQALPIAPQVRVLDAFATRVAGVPVTFAVTSGGGSVLPVTVQSDTGGYAQTTWTLGGSAGANTMSATVSGVPPVVFSATAGAALPAITLLLPGNLMGVGAASGTLAVKLGQPAPAGGLTVTVTSDSLNTITVANPGTIAFAQGDTLKTIALNGVAFGQTIVRATAPGYTAGQILLAVTPNVIIVQTGVTVTVGQNASVGITLSAPAPVGGLAVSVVSTDTTKLTINAPPQVTIPAGTTTGSISVHGVAAGTAGLLASATSYASGAAAVTVTTVVSNVASTTVTPKIDTLTAIGATRTLTAQAKDASGNNVSGSFTWVSRSAAVATVNGSGVVTAVADGTTYIVATEAGGTSDSARITVQQRIATINVTPAARNLYLLGTFQYSAQAVDGLGHPLAVQPTFTWSTTAPAVATVNATGLVTAIGLGSAQIRATSGTVIGVGNLQVITPITRIAVVVDTVGSAKTDTFTLTSLGLPRRYRAIAHDTLDVVMSGVTFTWQSTNGSVAVMNSTTGDTASAVSAANGLTNINATAQGFTSAPGALLTVSQVLASIDLQPDASNPTATIGITGTVHVSARGKDANNRFIPGGNFTYASATTAVATVDAVTGVVTGVANGTSAITASSGAITSNTVTVTVGGAVPAIISFGRDTVSVGRGASASIPILLSKPVGSPLTVNLTAPAFAHWSSASVVIPANQTSINATLVGDSAGTTIVTATDGSGLGYASGTAVAKVTANMSLTSGGYSVLATDIVSTQVVLSDPSPAGGTYVTFSFGTPGKAAVSPDPAFIPAGQLAADIQIRGLAAGSTSITPVALGVNGAASTFTVYAPVLYPSTTFQRLGQGQYEPNGYVYTQVNTNTPIPVTVTSSDTTIVTVTPSITIPGGTNYAYFTTTAVGLGTATLTFSAPGWTANNQVTVVSTTPRVGVCCGGNLLTTNPQTSVNVYAMDSVQTAHYRTSSLVVQLRSTDTTIMKVIDTLVTIGPGNYYTNARVIPGGLGGTAYVVATASGHRADSTLFTVTGPSLYFSWSNNLIGAGQVDYNQYVYVQNNVTQPLVVTLVNPDTASLDVPATVTIPTNSNYAYFNVIAKVPNSVTLTATAPGYTQTTGTYRVTSPRVTISGGYTVDNFSPARSEYVYATDSLGNAHYRVLPLALTLSSTDTNVVKIDTVGTIPAGQYYTTTPPQLLPTGLGTARVKVLAAGHGPDSTSWTVVTPKLNLSWYSYMIGRRQHRYPTDFYVYTPDSRPVTVPVTLTSLHPAVESLTTTTPLIAAGNNYQYFTFYALSNGVDTVIAQATGYLPDTAFIQVTSPRFTVSGLPGSTTTTNPPIGLTVYATDSLGNAHYASDTVIVKGTPSDSTVIRPTQTYVPLVKDAYYVSPTVTVVGPGSASITYSDSAGSGYGPATTNTMSVTGPSFAIYTSTPVLGMRQRGGANTSYVYTQNAVGAPLVVTLVSTDPRVASVPATATIPTGQNYAYFEVTALDTVGTIQIQATATGYGSAATNIQVTQPRFVISTSGQLNTTSSPATVTVYATDANGNAHYTTEDVVVNLLSSAPSVANLDSGTVTIVNGNYYNSNARWLPGVVGTAQFSATDQRAAQYKYNTGTQNVAVVTPSLFMSWGTEVLGIGQYLDEYLYTPDNAVNPITVDLTHTGAPRIATLVGGQPVTQLTVPQGTNVAYFRIVGSASGTDTLTASATSPAHSPRTAYTQVGPGRSDPIGNWPTTIAFGDSVQVTLYTRDPNGNGRYVLNNTDFTPTLTNLEFWSGGANSAKLTTVTVPAGQYYVTFWVKATGHGTGSGTVAATNYQTQTLPTVVVP